MLFGQQLGGRHEGHLLTRLDRSKRGERGDHRLATANIAPATAASLVDHAPCRPAFRSARAPGARSAETAAAAAARWTAGPSRAPALRVPWQRLGIAQGHLLRQQFVKS